MRSIDLGLPRGRFSEMLVRSANGNNYHERYIEISKLWLQRNSDLAIPLLGINFQK